jgi:hypothetical protein
LRCALPPIAWNTVKTLLDATLANELRIIGLEFDRLFQIEQSAAAELKTRFAEGHSAVETLLQAVEVAKTDGRWRKTQFNLFEVLGRPRLELAHSRFLAWLLDPLESHGFDDAFLRGFMRKSGILEMPSTVDLTVSRELKFDDGRFDIHIKGDRWCLVVENKIDAVLSSDQRDRYQKYCASLIGRGQQAWLVYVTPSERPPSGYWLSYRGIRQMLEQIMELLSPPRAARMAIEQFCEHVFAEYEA